MYHNLTPFLGFEDLMFLSLLDTNQDQNNSLMLQNLTSLNPFSILQASIYICLITYCHNPFVEMILQTTLTGPVKNIIVFKLPQSHGFWQSHPSSFYQRDISLSSFLDQRYFRPLFSILLPQSHGFWQSHPSSFYQRDVSLASFLDQSYFRPPFSILFTIALGIAASAHYNFRNCNHCHQINQNGFSNTLF